MYGTTIAGGASGDGTIFSLGAGGFSLVHSLDVDLDGGEPAGGLVLVAPGHLLGVARTASGRRGTVVRVSPVTGESLVEYEFGLADQGSVPMGGLIPGADGAFYGTTNVGGPAGGGTVFRATPAGAVTVIHPFTDYAAGAYATSLMRASDGNFYGTTEFGGAFGDGTVYRLTPAGAHTLLHSFSYDVDGYDPWGRLVEGYDGALYGTTVEGGSFGGGTLFRITKGGTLTVLASFDYEGGASYTLGPVVVGRDGSVYGALAYGGEGGPAPYGAVFKVDPDGQLTWPHTFSDTDGAYPVTGLIKGADGAMYGTTWAGGSAGGGVLYRITEDGIFSVLHNFNPAVASEPFGLLRAGGDGKLYGSTTLSDETATGTSGGVLYEFDTTGNSFTVLHAFDDPVEGSGPFGLFGVGLRDTLGNYHALYGANSAGADGGGGALFLFDGVTVSTPGGITIANSAPDAYASGTPNPAEATSPAGAVVTLSGAGSLDQDYDPLDFAWHGPFGSVAGPTLDVTLPIGTTTVTLDVTDPYGAMSSTSLDIVVQDTTAPVISVPAGVTVEATGPTGAIALFDVTALDKADGSTLVDCQPASGSLFAPGSTTVSCSASDASGNSASASFQVTVEDTTPPVLTVSSPVPGTVVGSGAIVTFTASALDLVDVDPAPTVTCDPASGTVFSSGSTPVTCSSTDSSGNTATSQFVVTVDVTNSTALTISVPGSVTVEATGPAGTTATFAVAASGGNGAVLVTCVPLSGSSFPLGPTSVICTATDSVGSSSSASFPVIVQDTTPPVMTVPASVAADATVAGGVAVTFSARDWTWWTASCRPPARPRPGRSSRSARRRSCARRPMPPATRGPRRSP